MSFEQGADLDSATLCWSSARLADPVRASDRDGWNYRAVGSGEEAGAGPAGLRYARPARVAIVLFHEDDWKALSDMRNDDFVCVGGARSTGSRVAGESGRVPARTYFSAAGGLAVHECGR